MAMDSKRREVGRQVAWLKRHFRPLLPVRVNWHENDNAFENKGADAETVSTMPGVDKQPHGHLIRLMADRSTETTMTAVFDEWAHVLRTQLPIPIDENDPHDAIWGVIHAAIWSKWTKEE